MRYEKVPFGTFYSICIKTILGFVVFFTTTLENIRVMVLGCEECSFEEFMKNLNKSEKVFWKH